MQGMDDKAMVPATFEPDTPELRAEFERAYSDADLSDVPRGGINAAQRVQAAMREKHPQLTISVALGPRWIVAANE
jgi:hypothetical protein